MRLLNLLCESPLIKVFFQNCPEFCIIMSFRRFPQPAQRGRLDLLKIFCQIEDKGPNVVNIAALALIFWNFDRYASENQLYRWPWYVGGKCARLKATLATERPFYYLGSVLYICLGISPRSVAVLFNCNLMFTRCWKGKLFDPDNVSTTTSATKIRQRMSKVWCLFLLSMSRVW